MSGTTTMSTGANNGSATNTPERTSIESNTPERTSIESNTQERSSIETNAPEKTSIETNAPKKTSIESGTQALRDDRPLAGQRALVTGATGGLGAAIAEALGRDGAEVTVLGRDRFRGAETVARVQEAGGQATFVAAELADADSISQLAEELGDVDILVNNAGFAVWGATNALPVSDFDAMFAANVRAPYYLVAAIAPRMAARGRGSIINIGSMAGTIGLNGGAAYGATKAAIGAMTRAWAAEYGPFGVRVNNVAPGPIYTRPEARERFERLGNTTALKRASEPREIAELVAFLASPKASYITGATLAADGGRTAI